MHYITVVSGYERGKFVELQNMGKIFIGKNENNDLQLTDQGVSRQHCCVWLEDQKVWIEDLGSSNGTFLKKGSISDKAQIKVNDFIMVGYAKLQLQNEHPRKISDKIDTRKTDPNIIYHKKEKTPTFSQEYRQLNVDNDLVFLHTMGKMAHRQLEIPELVSTFLKQLVNILDIKRGCIALNLSFSSNQNDLTIVYCTKQEEEVFSLEKFPLNQLILDTAFVKNEGTISNKFSNTGTTSTLCVPLQGYNRTVGVFYLESISKIFEQNNLDLLKAVGRQLAFAIERTILEKELISSEQRSIIEHSRDVIYRHKKDFNFTIVSKSVKDLIGFSPDEILNDGQIWKNCVYAEDQKLFDDKVKKVLLGQESTIEFRMKKKNGEIVWVEETSYLIKDKDGHSICIQGLAKDITEKKSLEEKVLQAQKVEVMGDVAAGVAHDLNNTLGGLFGYPDLVLKKLPIDSPLRGYIQHIKTSAIRATEIVRDLVLLGKKETKELTYLDLNVFINNYLQSVDFSNLKSMYSDAKILIELTPTSLSIFSFSKHIVKIIMNLMINAFEAMPKGGTLKVVTSCIYLDKEEHQGNYAVLRVSDTGEAIAKEDLKRIFEPFYIKKIRKRGSGLGLAVAYKLIQDSSGHIDIESTPGLGTAFIVYFPIKQKASSKSSDDPLVEGNETILLVDDIEAQRVLGEDFLTSLGYKVISVASGEKALEYLKQNSVDLILLDMILEGGIDGLETYKRAIEIHPRQKAIIVSGYSCNQKVKTAMSLGVGDYIAKPYALDTLAASVRKELDRS